MAPDEAVQQEKDQQRITKDTPRKVRESSRAETLDERREEVIRDDVGHIPLYDINTLIESVLPHIDTDLFEQMKSEVFKDRKSVKGRFRNRKPSQHKDISEQKTFLPLQKVFNDIASWLT